MKRVRETFWVWNLVLLALAMVWLVYYDRTGGLWRKGVASGWFVLLGAVNLLYARKIGCKTLRFPLLAELALFLTMEADVLLGIHFMLGTAVFAVGHLAYFAAFCALEKFSRRDLGVTAVIGAVSLFLVLGTPLIQVEDPAMQVLLAVYAVVISCMLGKAIGNLRRSPSRTRWLLAIGGGLFWFSDLMLALNMFGSGGHTAGTLCLYTYWPGQNLLAHALFHYANENAA